MTKIQFSFMAKQKKYDYLVKLCMSWNTLKRQLKTDDDQFLCMTTPLWACWDEFFFFQSIPLYLCICISRVTTLWVELALSALLSLGRATRHYHHHTGCLAYIGKLRKWNKRVLPLLGLKKRKRTQEVISRTNSNIIVNAHAGTKQ